jgi:hypothetical protein
VEHHVEEEESDLFPKVKKILDAHELTKLAEQMQATMTKLESGGPPRRAVPAETRQAAPLK